MLKTLKCRLILLAIIVSLLIAKRLYEDYQFVKNWQRAQDMLGMPWEEINRMYK